MVKRSKEETARTIVATISAVSTYRALKACTPNVKPEEFEGLETEFTRVKIRAPFTDAYVDAGDWIDAPIACSRGQKDLF